MMLKFIWIKNNIKFKDKNIKRIMLKCLIIKCQETFKFKIKSY